MRFARTVFFLPFALLPSAWINSQQPTTTTPQRDPQAIAILTQSLNTAGGLQSLIAIQDVQASGTINFFWAGQNVQGTATAKSRGIGEFRLDATLPDGTRSWKAINGNGSFVDVDGTMRLISAPSSVEMGGMTFPYVTVVAAIQDSSATISYVGLETRDGVAVHHIRLGLNITPGLNMVLTNNPLLMKEVFVDPNSFHIVAVQGKAYLTDNLNITVPHSIHFSDYRVVNGILVPFSIQESISGQPTLSIEFSQMTINPHLTDEDFR